MGKYSDRTAGLTIFSENQVNLMLNALNPLDSYLDHVGKVLPNVAFAKDVVILLRGKLQQMIRERNYMEVFGLDSNEILILHAAVMAFSYGLTAIEDSPEKRIMVDDCSLLTAHFSAILSSGKAVKLQA